jgi:hypothetical protein
VGFFSQNAPTEGGVVGPDGTLYPSGGSSAPPGAQTAGRWSTAQNVPTGAADYSTITGGGGGATTSPASGGTPVYSYSGAWGGFNPESMPGGPIDRSAGNAKYYATTVLSHVDPDRFASDPAYAQQAVAELNNNQYGIKYWLNGGRLMMQDKDGFDGAYISGGSGGWNWSPGAGGGGGTGGGAAGNFSTGTFTGGGQYPLASVMGEGLMQPWTTPFTAPNDVTEQNDPGFQFRLKEGIQGLQRSAAAKGTLLTGGTLKDINSWAQDYASNEYDKVYNRAKGEYDTAYGIFNTNAGNQFNRMYTLSNQGLNAAGAGIGAGQTYANNAGTQMTNAGNATAAGQAASGQAWGNLAGTLGNTAATAATAAYNRAANAPPPVPVTHNYGGYDTYQR